MFPNSVESIPGEHLAPATKSAGVAQLEEHLSCKQRVTGSIPVISFDENQTMRV